MTIDKLDGPNGRRVLKQAIKTQLNVLLSDLSDEAIQDIFFPEFLIQ
ncbi:MAG: flagellar basal body-associated FliL family protein [Pontiellaceae bacterium]|nr:flagellar basal body-associated FliL family protein [Pontiellaceae bacterium]